MPTIGEVVSWIILAIAALSFLFFCLSCKKADYIKVSEEKIRNWESDWEKKTK